MLCDAKFIPLSGLEGLASLFFMLCVIVCILVLIFFALHLAHLALLPSPPSIHHHFIHKQLQLKPSPNLASRPYLCTDS